MVKALWKLIFLASTLANASFYVAFFECRNGVGELVYLEEKGRFCHVAIQTNLGWVEANQGEGVRVIESLKKFGSVAAFLYSEKHKIDQKKLKKWLGKPYDTGFDWQNNNAFYCSELVAKLIQKERFRLKKMTFSGDYWKKHSGLPYNSFGISPDDLFNQLIQKGFIEKNCNTLF